MRKFRRREPYRWRKGDWFLDERPKKERTWTLKLALLVLGAYSLVLTADQIYREGADDGYDKGRLRGYNVGFAAGKQSVTCPRPWVVTMAAPAIID